MKLDDEDDIKTGAYNVAQNGWPNAVKKGFTGLVKCEIIFTGCE